MPEGINNSDKRSAAEKFRDIQIGQNIKAARTREYMDPSDPQMESGMKAKELADLTGTPFEAMTEKDILDIEAGSRSATDYELDEIANALGVDKKDLTHGRTLDDAANDNEK